MTDGEIIIEAEKIKNNITQSSDQKGVTFLEKSILKSGILRIMFNKILNYKYIIIRKICLKKF